MLEELCKGALWDICKACEAKAPLVRFRGSPKQVSVFEHFFGYGYVYNFDFKIINEVSRARKGGIKRSAWLWFNENADAVCNGFIRKRWGTVERAMIQCGTFENLYDDFQIYFAERKNALMEKTQNALEKRTAELASKGEKPQSYGGVANLLKVLRKTSEEQGSSIQTVAKVQFAVCLQAGIFIPDEFLTDVMTATDIMED